MKPPKEKDYQTDAERIDLNAINVFMKRFLVLMSREKK